MQLASFLLTQDTHRLKLARGLSYCTQTKPSTLNPSSGGEKVLEKNLNGPLTVKLQFLTLPAGFRAFRF